MGKRLLTGVLSAVLILSNIPATGLQVQANEVVTATTEVENVVETEVYLEESGEIMSTEECDEIVDAGEDMSEEDVTVVTETEETGAEVEETMREDTVEETETATEFETEIYTTEISATSLTNSTDKNIASGTSNEINWVIDKNGHLTIEGTGNLDMDIWGNTYLVPPWYSKREYIKTAEVNVTGMTDASAMFRFCTELESIDFNRFDTSTVTNMSFMFQECSKLSGLENLKTDNVKDMSGMFAGVQSETINVGGLNTSNVTTMASMFSGAQITNINLSNFDTSDVTDMSDMFGACKALEKLDLSNFDTSKVTDMSGMFAECNKLESINIQGFDTSKVTDFSIIFENCFVLEDIDLSNINTESATDISGMFWGCKTFTNLDLSGFNTENVTNMWAMFYVCENLRTINISSFNTSKVTNMKYMFKNCSSLSNLDLSNFNTENVENIIDMFYGCSNLEYLDLSSFNTKNVSDESIIETHKYVFANCKRLSTIYTPSNLSVTVNLPKDKSGDVWYKADRATITQLPQNLSYSMVISKNEVPKVPDPYITINKTKTSYECGDTINTEDIIVKYYNSMGAVIVVTEGYTTNAAEIDMTTPGNKELVVTYNELSAIIILEVTCTLKADEIDIILPEVGVIYNSKEQTPVPQVSVKESETILTEGEDYNVSYKNNINVGTEAKVIITGQNNYRGTLEKTFTINPATLTITAKDKLCVFGDELPTDEDFSYRISGLCGTDKLVMEPSFTCPVTDMNVVGTYPITPYGAAAGVNYEITYVNGTLTVQEEGMVYSVTFDTMGYGEEIAAITGIKTGSLIMEPKKPEAADWVFGGWYKDKACTKVWDFEKDTVQGDMTLYACWLSAVEEGEYKLSVQEIKDQSYTGSALKPAIRVYAADGSTLLKSGKDYTIKYYNNTVADMEEERGLGGVNTTGKEGEGGFTLKLPYVLITGKGDYTGSVYRNFHITPASIGDGSDAAGGITLKYSDQLTVNAKKDQKPMSSLKYKKSMKAGTDYTVTLRVLDAKDGNGNILTEGQTVDAGSAPVIPRGYNGRFTMLVEGTGNYTGSIEKVIYVSNKNNLIKHATITLGKNLKKMSYNDGEEITLTPGWYDAKAKKYYKVNADGSLYEEAEKNADNLFTVKVGSNYLRYGTDYVVSYENNSAVGSAVMTVIGIGDYAGSKTLSYTIMGQVFSTKNIVVGSEFKTSVMYTGRPQTQNNVTITTKTGEKLIYGVHYTVSYTNNLKKGTATMKFTAKPESGYTGNFTKKFIIKTPALLDATNLITVSGTDSIETGENKVILKADIPYSRNGSTPADRIQLVNKTTGAVLKAGSDYTVSYANHKAVTTESIADNKLPVMTLKGKNNYTGSIKIEFNISEASFEENENVSIKASSVIFNAAKKDNYQYKPTIKVVDNKKSLSLNKDYKLEYVNCMQPQVKVYLAALADGSKTAEELQAMRPKAVITVVEGKGYAKGGKRTIDLPIYITKLTASNIYVVVSGENTTHTGAQITPAVEVYFGDAKAIKAAKKALETRGAVLTDESGAYKLMKLSVGDDYSYVYGSNIRAGKNKGSVTVTGSNLYGGSVTTKFTIKSRNVY